jgi:type II secretory pathway component PulF
MYEDDLPTIPVVVGGGMLGAGFLSQWWWLIVLAAVLLVLGLVALSRRFAKPKLDTES